MTQGPTTINGPLNTPEADIGARRVVAYFTTQQEAEAAKSALIGAGIAGTQISIMEARGNRSDLQPADKSIIGHIREALLPDDGQVGKRAAIADNDVTLTVLPQDGEVDRIVDIIQASNPHHFAPALERWRNSPATT
ncbi:hypothetical protein [Acidisphaera sp. L21]|uniref:hypothetical protein n=1 Tax=Acidisphaera sp. L21 TaxID=1641851 RepID=UPI00131DB309|nr:hypothetical protein [Acidisphaera sp. L21]